MPSYDFRCVECRKKFSLTMGIKERGTKRLKCPKCGAGKPEAIFTPFFAKTSRKS
ncbi:MAG: zinc ribbon domain-containing protein [Candidatus Methylomirabilota bacterium]|nr:zinc ribbon domain-containing protein [Candidatus Methylomirabilis sp.]NJD67100.1 zinc ribbon domain-containing protein [candidate division NC10 bacterium]PWB47879.1 MAG: zinc ribbon domain-containing protein [candidate division NC10 bacterium]